MLMCSCVRACVRACVQAYLFMCTRTRVRIHSCMFVRDADCFIYKCIAHASHTTLRLTYYSMYVRMRDTRVSYVHVLDT